MPLLQEDRKLVRSASALAPVYAQKQRRRMLVALVVLLIALLLVFIRDRQFWFPVSPAAETQTPAHGTAAVVPPASAAKTTGQKPASAAKSRGRAPQKAAPAEAGAAAVTINRAVLPPLQVEVVAGNQRQTVRPSETAVNVELQPSSPEPAQDKVRTSPATDASERVRLSPETGQVVSRPVEPSYPTLARQMKVQGSVVLQALIGREGNIQDLRVLSGPGILSSAALEAVKQWRFKPYYQQGQPVESQCSITVNFTISTQ